MRSNIAAWHAMGLIQSASGVSGKRQCFALKIISRILLQLGWLRFTAWDAAGEAIWVLVYVMLGFIFAAQLPELVDIVGEWAGLVSSGAVAGLMGSLLIWNFKRLYKRTRT